MTAAPSLLVSSPALGEVGGLRSDATGVLVVWRRELIRFTRDRTRVITSLVQPVLFLFVLGTGLSTIARTVGTGISFKTFMFPGILGMTVLFTSVFSAISIVWDREFGFLREMLVAPVARWSIVLGKCLGGTTVASIQGCIMLAFAGAVGVPYDPLMIVTVVGELALMAFTLTAFGVLVASRMEQMQSFQVVIQFFVMPMFFLSGAMFPLSGLPAWLQALTKLDPLSYAVDPVRRCVFEHLHASRLASAVLNPGISWNGWKLPVGVELAMVAGMAVVLLGAAMAAFSRVE